MTLFGAFVTILHLFIHFSDGDMRHLIVEACIARNLIDTSAYFWPGYVSAPTISPSDTSPVPKSPWSTFMEGTPLRDSLINSLFMTPASRYNKKYLNIIGTGADL